LYYLQPDQSNFVPTTINDPYPTLQEVELEVALVILAQYLMDLEME
jgi:hypothetical protein